MKNEQRRMQEILGKDVQILKLVEEKLQETYEMLNAKNKAQKTVQAKKIHRYRSQVAAAAIAAVLLCGMSGTVYAAAKKGYFNEIFGMKKATQPETMEVKDEEKGTSYIATIPGKEFAEVDEKTAEELLGKYSLDKPIVRKLGEHTLTIENFIYDRNGAIMYFTIEKPGGVTAFDWDKYTNLTKGAGFSDEADFYLSCQMGEDCTEGNLYVDGERSTAEKLYCTSYILWSREQDETEKPSLKIEKYPCSRGEFDRMTEEEFAALEVKTESIMLGEKPMLLANVVDMGEKGTLTISPFTMGFEIGKVLGIDFREGQKQEDPFYVKYVEIQYENGENYVVEKEDEINNTGYVLGAFDGYKIAFNRLVNVNKIKNVIINDVTIPVK